MRQYWLRGRYDTADEMGLLMYHDAMYPFQSLLSRDSTAFRVSLCVHVRLCVSIARRRYGQPWFGGNSGVAVDNKMQDAELRYQLRRLSAHPCVFIWDACNECGGKGTCKSTR